MWHDSSEPLVATLLRRSRGVPLTVSIHYYIDCTLPFDCDCSHQPTWEPRDYCPHKPEKVPPLGLLESSRARIHTLNVRYLRNETLDGGTMEDILKSPFFFKSFPNLESLRWSCRHLNGAAPTFKFPRKLFGSSLPRLQKLSMVNCWGLHLADIPMLKVMSVESTSGYMEISTNQLVRSLGRRQSLTSLSLSFCITTPDNYIPRPVSVENLKEITLLKVNSEDVLRYLQCPSIGTITTLRIAPVIRSGGADGRSVNVTAIDSLGGSLSSSTYLSDDTSLVPTLEMLALVSRQSVTTLEVESLHLIIDADEFIPQLIDVLPDLHTIRARLPPVVEGFEVLRKILSRGYSITRLERLVVETESPGEARRSDEKWKALCVEHEVDEFTL